MRLTGIGFVGFTGPSVLCRKARSDSNGCEESCDGQCKDVRARSQVQQVFTVLLVHSTGVVKQNPDTLFGVVA